MPHSCISRARSSTAIGAGRCSSGGWRRRAASITAISYLVPANDLDGDVLDADALFVRGRFPNTAARMRFFETHAPKLAAEAVERLLPEEERHRVSHLLITCCTGLSSPGLDLELIERCELAGLGRADDARLHGLLRGDQRAEARAPHRPLRRLRRASSSSTSSFARCISRRRPTSSRSSRSCSGATAAPRAS